MSPFKEDPTLLVAPDRGDLFTSTDIPPRVPPAGPQMMDKTIVTGSKPKDIPWGLILAGVAAAYLLLR